MIGAAKWIAVAATALIVVVAAVAFWCGRVSVAVPALEARHDTLTAALARNVETVTVYVAQAARSAARSDSAKHASDHADSAVAIVDSTTLGVQLTPAAPPTLVVVPPQVTHDLTTLRATVAAQATTILDERAARVKAIVALDTARLLVHTDSLLIVTLKRHYCDNGCKLTLVSIGVGAGVLLARH